MPRPPCSEPLSELDLPDLPQPRTPGYNEFIFQTKLCLHLSCTRYPIGAWDLYGVRVLTNEVEEYASVHFRIPVGLPVAWATQLATLSTQRVFYTARDREWDKAGGGGPTSDRNRWSGFVDSVIAAVDFARAALETAVWAHARDEEWHWPYSPPGRVEDKYELWGDGHPNFYDPEEDYEKYLQDSGVSSGGPTADDIEF